MIQGFVPSFGYVAAPFNKRLGKDEPTQVQALTAPEKNETEQLGFLLTNPPVLACLQADGHLTFDTDTCDAQLGCVVLQKQQYGMIGPIEYSSRKLVEPEKKLATTHEVCIVVVWAVLLLRAYLEGILFTVRTDQEALTWQLTVIEPTGKLSRGYTVFYISTSMSYTAWEQNT